MITCRAVSEFGELYVFHLPGPVDFDRARLEPHAWADWGSRQVWDISSVRRHDRHPAEFPAELALRVVALFSAPRDLVLDCFVGQGTTAAAAALGRRYFGVEREPRWASLAAARRARLRPPPQAGRAVSERVADLQIGAVILFGVGRPCTAR